MGIGLDLPNFHLSDEKMAPSYYLFKVYIGDEQLRS